MTTIKDLNIKLAEVRSQMKKEQIDKGYVSLETIEKKDAILDELRLLVGCLGYLSDHQKKSM